jgi:hypothetical protein
LAFTGRVPRETFSFSLDRPYAKALRYLAARDDRTMSAYLRQLALAHIRATRQLDGNQDLDQESGRGQED